ncbi:hypothetical protein BCUN_0213 [Bifidobacterium cuniculi]|uniref:IrrE N-terminal-like domain-containing protein n=1 Tax=Bifidobacterium cuniculi TaxID=1688 RepID=A0A087B3W8_9BIFI|nr:hypothetical protein BCUN_0213 [Bifidobacterium cuniculi]
MEYEASKWAHVDEAQLQPGKQGLWVPRFNLIILDEHLSPVQRRCVLAHEISHAKHRDMGCRCDRWTERRADMEASALLIDPLEYAFAESVWGRTCMGSRWSWV